MPDTVTPPPEGIPVNTDKVTANLLNQISKISLMAAQWQALAEEMMGVTQEQQQIINELKARPVHNGRTTKPPAKSAAAKRTRSTKGIGNA